MNRKVKENNKRAVIFGLDGATWDLLMPWVEKGLLPNIEKLLKKGAWGTISSTIPPVTGTAWASFATGRNPASHGCLNFLIPGSSLSDTMPLDRDNLHGDNIFDILEKNGKRSIVVNLPYTIPPKTKKAIYLANFLCIYPQQIFPASLKQEIAELKNYKTIINPEAVFGKEDDIIDEIMNVSSERFNASKKLFKNYSWDCFFIMFGATDWIQHKKYGDLISGKEKLGSKTMNAYKKLDSYIGWFLTNMPKDSLFVLLSDHGFGQAKWKFSINNWLIKKGYLKLRNIRPDKNISLTQGARHVLNSKPKSMFGIFIKSVFKILISNPKLYVLSGQISRLLVKRVFFLAKIIPEGLTTIGLEVDTKNTVVYTLAGTSATIYINDKMRFRDGIVKKKNYLKIKNQLIKELKELKDPDGNKAFVNVYSKEEIYKGTCMDIAPDILLEEKDVTSTCDFGKGEIFSKVDDSSGWHQDNGILVLYHKNLKKVNLGKVPILNIAPTVLEFFNIKVPKEIEGKALEVIRKFLRDAKYFGIYFFIIIPLG